MIVHREVSAQDTTSLCASTMLKILLLFLLATITVATPAKRFQHGRALVAHGLEWPPAFVHVSPRPNDGTTT